MNNSVKRKKLSMGLIYGLVAGSAFALFAFGIDAFQLFRANAIYPWLKFIPAFLACLAAGGLVGLLTMAFENHKMALLLWGLFALFCSWLVVWLPFSGSQYFLDRIDPGLAQYFNFKAVQDLYQYRLVSLATLGLAAIISGLLEINLVQQASTSSNYSSILAAVLVCTFLFALAGSATDQAINTNLREPVQVINEMLQFARENQGKEVSKQVARSMHLSAARNLGDLIQKDRRLALVSYDQGLGMVDVLVNFEGTLVKCSAIYSQPTDCTILTLNP
jgi:hypothetical protein